jgi:P27 family predicted phage terminase small subunit
MIIPPEWLNEEAKGEWLRVLATGAVVEESDCSVFAAYCQNYARWMQAEKILEAEGTEVIIRDDKGNVKRVSASPQVGISRGALAAMLKAAGQLRLRANVTNDGRMEATAGCARSSTSENWFN